MTTNVTSTSLLPKNCFVGMFDVIGFKALRELKGTSGLHQQFIRGMLPAIQHAAAGKGKVEKVNGMDMYVPNFAGSCISYRFISDSVIFFSPDDSFDSFFQIVNSAFMLLQSGFNGGKAPYRGAISWGDLVDDPRGILLGSAIEDAHAGESCQTWAGAMLTKACRDYVDQKKFVEAFAAVHLQASEIETEQRSRRTAEENSKKLVRFPVPTQHNPKDGPAMYSELPTYVIDWTIRMYEGASRKSFDPSTSLHSQTIAKNTQDFEEWARKYNRKN